MQYKILILIIFIHIGNIKAGLASDGSLTQTAESLTPEYNEEIIKHRLSETQTFWPEQPYTYEQGIKRILADFAEMPSGELEKRISHHIFKGIVETPIDSHQSNRDLLLRVKCNLILQCLNIPEINDDLLTWLDIARVHGDVQSYIIPNYTQQGGLTHFNAMDASSEEELH